MCEQVACQYRKWYCSANFTYRYGVSLMNNIVTVGEIKRRGMAAIEEGLRHGPVRIVKRNKSAAVVLSEEEYLRLTGEQPVGRPRVTALQWLLSQPAAGKREKAEIDAELTQERAW